MKHEKSSNKPPCRENQKALVNIKDALFSLMMGFPTKEWGEPLSPGLMFCQTLTQEFLQTEPVNNNTKNGNARIIHVGNTILAAAAESRIKKKWCLLDNQWTCNAFINGKYLSNIRDVPDGQYIHVHCNAGVKQSKILVTFQDIPILSGITPRE